jgi:hypothetical protein
MIKKNLELFQNLNRKFTLAAMYSASSGESSCNFWAISLNDIRAYDKLIILIPVLITLCRNLIINDQVFSC